MVSAPVIVYPPDLPVTARREDLLAAIRGKKVADARAILEAYGVVDITLSPDFTGTLPSDEGRLELTVRAPQGASR